MRQCPNCNEKLDVDTGITRGPDGKYLQSTPRIGDVTICLHCGEFAEYGPGDTLFKITDEDKLTDIRSNPDAILAQKVVNAVKESSDYNAQLKAMAKDVREWCLENPSLSPALQRNSTSRVGIIGILSEAIEYKFVSANEDGLKMFQDLGWLTVGKRAPTVFMAEAAIELAFKDTVD